MDRNYRLNVLKWIKKIWLLMILKFFNFDLKKKLYIIGFV